MMRRDGELALADVRGVEVAHWDPRRYVSRWGAPTRLPRPVGNFGDLLGPLVVRALVSELGLERATEPARLLAIGSILHFAQPSDTVWGAGVNTKAGTEVGALPGIDVRAVRGPRTRGALKALAIPAPPVYGDPGLLLGALRPDLVVAPAGRFGYSIVPNLNELGGLRSREHVVNPRWPLRRVLERIASSELVVGSSLHGVIVAESLGVPARAVRTAEESTFKYEDYYLATGRDPDTVLADSVDDALARGGAEPPVWDARPLLNAFPTDLWAGTARAGRLEEIARRLQHSRTETREEIQGGHHG